MASLADLAGKLTVSLHVERQDGFDESKLQNGVIEPGGLDRVAATPKGFSITL